ncbi:MAG TPA: glycosyl hydrolase 53 family protein [Oceanipulchritudo sp.]|nr:glycosyl hydrolase 53 family protein [Oceanipulchritudo sp.]
MDSKLSRSPLAIGADISLYKRLHEAGVVYKCNGMPATLPELLVEKGYTHARLRLFHSPSGQGAQVNDLEYTRDLAKTCKAAGLKLLLCLHYSDSWADPGKQHPPSAWKNQSFHELEHSIREYTRDLFWDLLRAGLEPEMVQVGNEITPGMLWEHGRISKSHSINTQNWSEADFVAEEENWIRFARLLRAGIRGVRDALGSKANVMIHIDRGGDAKTAVGFFRKLAQYHLDFNTIGLSYYPFWHGTLQDLRTTIQSLHEATGKEIHIVEVALPASTHPIYEGDHKEENAALLGITGTREVEYPISPEGQAQFLRDLHAMLLEMQPEGARGLFYWAPEWIRVEGYEDEPDAGPCYVRALFDSEGNALPALDAFVGKYMTPAT